MGWLVDTVRGWLRAIARPGGGHGARLVRRVRLECPHGRGTTIVELLMGRDGKPLAALRCSAHQSCPPTCDQACRACAEAVLSPAEAISVFPPGDGPLDTQD